MWLSLRASDDGRGCFPEVRDEGPGIPEGIVHGHGGTIDMDTSPAGTAIRAHFVDQETPG